MKKRMLGILGRLQMVALAGLLASAVLGPAAIGHAEADLPLSGGDLYGQASVGLGNYPGAQANLSVLGYASVNINKGDLVVISTSTSFAVAVSRTTTVADPRALGIALTTAAAKSQVRVAIYGLTIANTKVSSTIGQKFIPSTTAGYLTGCAAVSESLYTSLSNTALVFTALETRAVAGGDGQIVGFVHAR